MNRRRFILGLGASVSLFPGILAGRSRWPEPGRVSFSSFPKQKCEIGLTEAQEELLGLLRRHSRANYLLGGALLPQARRQEPPWTTLLIQANDLGRLKRALVRFGVQPISTAELPGNFVKFTHRDLVFNLIDGHIDDVCQRNALLLKRGLIPFAHSFLVYDPQGRELYDPYRALEQIADGGRFQISLLREPRGVLKAFDYALAARFESGLLDLAPSAALSSLEAFVFQEKPAEQDNKFIAERVINYLPDLVELEGYSNARGVLTAPLVRRAIQASLRVDVADVDAKAQAMLQSGQSVDDAAVLRLLNEAMGYRHTPDDFYKNVDHYMLAHSFPMRRVDLMSQPS